MRPFSARMFPNSVVIRKAECIESEQGGSNPYAEPADGRSYKASVQPARSQVETADTAFGQVDRTVTKYDVFIPRLVSDAFPATLIRGDQIEWNGLILSILGPSQNRGGYDVLWRIECEQVN